MLTFIVSSGKQSFELVVWSDVVFQVGWFNFTRVDRTEQLLDQGQVALFASDQQRRTTGGVLKVKCGSRHDQTTYQFGLNGCARQVYGSLLVKIQLKKSVNQQVVSKMMIIVDNKWEPKLPAYLVWIVAHVQQIRMPCAADQSTGQLCLAFHDGTVQHPGDDRKRGEKKGYWLKIDKRKGWKHFSDRLFWFGVVQDFVRKSKEPSLADRDLKCPSIGDWFQLIWLDRFPKKGGGEVFAWFSRDPWSERRTEHNNFSPVCNFANHCRSGRKWWERETANFRCRAICDDTRTGSWQGGFDFRHVRVTSRKRMLLNWDGPHWSIQWKSFNDFWRNCFIGDHCPHLPSWSWMDGRPIKTAVGVCVLPSWQWNSNAGRRRQVEKHRFRLVQPLSISLTLQQVQQLKLIFVKMTQFSINKVIGRSNSHRTAKIKNPTSQVKLERVGEEEERKTKWRPTNRPGIHGNRVQVGFKQLSWRDKDSANQQSFLRERKQFSISHKLNANIEKDE